MKSENETVDLSYLDKGIYFLEIKNKDSIIKYLEAMIKINKGNYFIYLENLSPKNLRCLDNLTSYKHSKYNIPIIICSDADLEIPEKYSVQFLFFIENSSRFQR